MSIPLDRLQAVVPVAGDALVDGEEEEVEAVVVPLVERLHDVGQDGGVLAARGADGDDLAALEELVLDDGEVDLGLEGPEEALLAEGVPGFGPLEREQKK